MFFVGTWKSELNGQNLDIWTHEGLFSISLIYFSNDEQINQEIRYIIFMIGFSLHFIFMILIAIIPERKSAIRK